MTQTPNKLLIVLQHRFDLWNAPDWFPERLRRDFPGMQVVYLRSFEGVERELANADVLVTWSLRPEQVDGAKKLRWIHSPAAAVHALLVPQIIASDIIVTNASDVHGPVVAEHTVALVLACAKRLKSAVELQQQSKWGQQSLWDERPRPRELRGSTMGIVGFGAIGREVARLASAFGMRILACREHPERESAPAERVYSSDDLVAMLPQCDFVVIAAPNTPQTRGSFNAKMFSCMKPEAYLINVARGALINEPDLISALRDRRIGGAALDVFVEEPLPAGSPFWTLPNVMLTPHSAALTANLWERHYARLSENLSRFCSGQPLLGIVDKRRGY